MQETSAVFSLRELRRLEDERVAGERADQELRVRVAEEARVRDEAMRAEAVRVAARAVEDARARDDAERVARELTERVARIQADAELAREQHATDRARLEAELAQARAQTPSRWPIWAGLAASIAFTALAAMWAGGRADDASRRAQDEISDLRAEVSTRIANLPSAPAPAPAPPDPTPTPKPTPKPAPPQQHTVKPPPPSDPPPPPHIKLCDPSSPLGCLNK